MDQPNSEVDYDLLRSRFQSFSEKECRGSSVLYERIAAEVAQDQGLLELASHAQPRQLVPNMLFAAVHYLLLAGADGELGRFYRSIAGDAVASESPYPAFKEFCDLHRSEIIELLGSRRVQTNEVRRCTYLYPVFCEVYRRTQKPLAVFEIGTAAGLQLMWDHYSYEYDGDGVVFGAQGSAVHLRAEIRGSHRPSVSRLPPPVVWRAGADIKIVDLADEDEALWLRALVWPEHSDRLESMAVAVDVIRAKQPRLIEGDGTQMVEDACREAPDDAMLCVFHTHVANQLQPHAKHELLETLSRAAEHRPLAHIYNNMMDGLLHLDMLGVADPSSEAVAETDGHARWFEWLPKE